jgi:hypothetical protein
LEIESLLRLIFEADTIVEVVRHDPGWYMKLISAVFNAEEPVFLRVYLSKCLMIVRLLREVRNPPVENLAETQDFIPKETVRSFGNLRE